MNICNEYYYNNEDKINKGSFSIVYKGINLKTNEVVAIKKITTNKNDKYIFNEINILMELKDKNNIIHLYNYYNIDNITYLVFNYCNTSLENLIKCNGSLGENISQNYFSQIVNGLKVLQEYNIYHRDLKPSNILIEENIIYICDFGLSKYMDNNSTDIKQSLVGSPLFMSPEIYDKLEYNLKSDLWSLGLILFEMLSGYNYLTSKNIPELMKKVKNNNVPKIDNISNNCENLLLKLLNKNIEKRISWEELFKHKWLICSDEIKIYNKTISAKSSFSTDTSTDDYLILSNDYDFDDTYQGNSFTFSDIFETLF